MTTPDVLQLNVPPHPRVWGGAAAAPRMLHRCSGHLFAFSGFDGVTDEEHPLIAVANDNHSLSLLFCSLDHPRTLLVHGQGLRDNVKFASSDAVIAHDPSSGAQLSMAWVARDLLAGQVTAPAIASLSGATPVRGSPGCSKVGWLLTAKLALCSAPIGRSADGAQMTAWGVAVGKTEAEAASRAKRAACAGSGCAIDLHGTLRARLAPFVALPAGGKYAPLLAKALSVMRVNSLSPQGKITRRWSTPDRLPHQWMWLWDSCYHSLAANRLNASLGWEYVAAVLDAAAPDGAIAIERSPTSAGGTVDQTQPPLLTWAVHENWHAALAAGVPQATVRARLAYALPRLGAYLRWDMSRRADPTGRTPLLVWTKGTESGMDNSPRFDGPGAVSDLLAVDFSTFLAREARLLAEVADAVGNATEGAYWAGVSANVSRHVHAVLWDERTGLYYDVHAPSGNRSAVAASTALLPLWLDDIPPERVPRLLSALRDPTLFGTTVPLPSVARRDASFSTDMWRGPVWVNSNYMTALAMDARGHAAEAKALMAATLDAWQAAYQAYGVIFEFLDADGKADPRTLLRKGHPSGGVRDYHWSAALAYESVLRWFLPER